MWSVYSFQSATLTAYREAAIHIRTDQERVARLKVRIAAILHWIGMLRQCAVKLPSPHKPISFDACKIFIHNGATSEMGIRPSRKKPGLP